MADDIRANADGVAAVPLDGQTVGADSRRQPNRLIEGSGQKVKDLRGKSRLAERRFSV
jgi:hypothetical protein